MPGHESRRLVKSAVPALQSRSMCNESPDGHGQVRAGARRKPLEGSWGVLLSTRNDQLQHPCCSVFFNPTIFGVTRHSGVWVD